MLGATVKATNPWRTGVHSFIHLQFTHWMTLHFQKMGPSKWLIKVFILLAYMENVTHHVLWHSYVSVFSLKTVRIYNNSCKKNDQSISSCFTDQHFYARSNSAAAMVISAARAKQTGDG